MGAQAKTSVKRHIENQMLPEWRVNKKHLIDEAIKLLKPQSSQREACREEVERVTLRLASTNAWSRHKDLISTNDGKAAALRLAKALRIAERALKDLGAYGGVLYRFISREELLDATQYYEEAAKTRSGKLTRKGAKAKAEAVEQAMLLMIDYATPHGEADNIKPGSRFCKLAALLFGKPADDLSNQCKAAVSKARKKPA